MAVLLALLLQVHVTGTKVDVFGPKEAAEKAAKEADAAAAHFEEIFGAAPTRGAIVLTADGRPAKDPEKDKVYLAKGVKFIWRWEPRRGAEPDETMAHELGHLWFIFWVDGLTPPAKKVYGSSLPDWLDEGVASLLEGPKAQAAYASEMRSRVNADTAMPLADLFGCVHPISREKTAKPKAADRWLFYAQTYSVVAFLAEACGSEALRHVVSTLRSGKRVEDALGAKKLPKTLAELESAWKEWVVRENPQH